MPTRSDIPDTASQYNNQYFDSKVEAMWAAYFDAAGIEWEREPDTFQLNAAPLKANWYTPDFYVPTWDSYVEIKDGRGGWENGIKLGYLAQGLGKAAILLNGRPYQNYDVYVYAPQNDGAQGEMSENYRFCRDDLFPRGKPINHGALTHLRSLWDQSQSVDIKSVNPLSLMAAHAMNLTGELEDSRRIIG